MKFAKLKIPDILLIEPRVFRDARGFFFENYNREVFVQNGISESFIQDNHSGSSLGVLRGLHYQIPPKAQAKMIRVVRGRIFDVVVDIRRSSPTFGKHVDVVLSEEEQRILYVPVGFAHGFCSLGDDTEVLYKVSEIYSPEHERGILWNDPSLGISWPKCSEKYILSEKDQKYPFLRDADLFP